MTINGPHPGIEGCSAGCAATRVGYEDDESDTPCPERAEVGLVVTSTAPTTTRSCRQRHHKAAMGCADVHQSCDSYQRTCTSQAQIGMSCARSFVSPSSGCFLRSPAPLDLVCRRDPRYELLLPELGHRDWQPMSRFTRAPCGSLALHPSGGDDSDVKGSTRLG